MSRVYFAINKFVFVFLRQLAMRHCSSCCAPSPAAAIDRHRLPAGPTAANPPHAAVAGKWDRQTDGRRTDSASKVTTLRRYTNLFIIIIIIIITLTLTLLRATRAVSKTAV